jgi:hypothetical protein
MQAPPEVWPISQAIWGSVAPWLLQTSTYHARMPCDVYFFPPLQIRRNA